MVPVLVECVLDVVSTPTSVLSLLLVFIVTYGLFTLRKPAGLPPGPMGYPFIGNILDLEKEPQLTITNYGKQYGDVFTIQIGSQPVIVLNTIDVIKEALVTKQNDFAGRPYFFSRTGVFAEEGEDIIFSNFTAKWKYLRKVGHQAIRNYASGGKLDDIVSKDAFPRFQKAVAEKKGEPFHPIPLLSLLVGNVIATICFGKKYELDDPEFIRIIRVLDEVNDAFGNGHVADFLPIFRYVPTRGITCLKRAMTEWLQLIQHNIDEQKKEFNKGNTRMRSLIGDILRIQQEAILAGDDQADQLTDINVRQTVSNMFVAGLDTTINSVDWSIAYLTCYPHVQEKVHKEIDDVIGRDRLPLLADKIRLPYCEAVIREVLRIRTIIPFAVPHATTCNTSVGGYAIPKDSWIWCNLWNVHMDERHWEHPNEFRPERFLDDDGNILPKPESLLPFSAGRRVCLGEALAKNELFLIFTSLFQQYTFKVPPNKCKPCLEPHCIALFVRCCKYEVIASQRSHLVN